MPPAQPKDNNNFITLRQAASMLGVSVETLLDWNDSNILKPTISQEGVIGYKVKQIQKFISAQNALQQIKTGNDQIETSNNHPSELGVLNNQINWKKSENKHSPDFRTGQVSNNTKDQMESDINKAKLISIGLTSTFLVVIISLLLPSIFSSTQINGTQGSEDTQALHTSELNRITSENNIGNNELESQDESEITTPSNQPNSPIALSAKDSSPSNDQLDSVPVTNNNKPNFAARPNLSNEAIAESDIASLGHYSLLQNERSLGRKFTSGMLIATISIGLLWAIYAYNQQPTYSAIPNNGIRTSPNNISSYVHNDNLGRALQVGQKTDGTVFIAFQDKEFKVSKPELNSETDQLIQKLLSNINEDKKEIHYDILEDETLNLNTPLSKIVTRLGFVGTKRDLFFPRTSKNKVVFRRYITDNELRSMEITEDEILSELKE